MVALMRALGAVIGIAFFFVLTACPGSPVKGELNLDDGGLHFVPVTNVSPKISRAEAGKDFDYSDAFMVEGPVSPVLGRVTTNATQGIYSYEKAPNLHNALAWVYFMHPAYPNFARGVCYHWHPPAHPAPNLPKRPSKAVAFIVDANTGLAYVYSGAGFRYPYCGYKFLPSFSRAGMTVSAPWTYRNGILYVKRPSCTDRTTWAGSFVRVLIGRCRELGSVHPEKMQPFEAPIDKPPPLGVDCGATYDPAIPKPGNCVHLPMSLS